LKNRFKNDALSRSDSPYEYSYDLTEGLRDQEPSEWDTLQRHKSDREHLLHRCILSFRYRYVKFFCFRLQVRNPVTESRQFRDDRPRAAGFGRL